MLVAKNIQKSYGQQSVLAGVSLTVSPGKITVLIGPSGSGKTSLVKALSFLDPPDAGEVIFEDTTFKFPIDTEVPLQPPWPELTVVFQQHFLWPHLTLRENILLPAMKRAESAKRIEQLIQHFQMTEFVDRYPNQVSLGQRQRAALARAFALNPKYILLDEITSSLDVEQTALVLSHLLKLREEGIGILVVSHHLGFARRLVSKDEGDRIAFMEAGLILKEGGRDFFDGQTSERIARFLAAAELSL